MVLCPPCRGSTAGGAVERVPLALQDYSAVCHAEGCWHVHAALGWGGCGAAPPPALTGVQHIPVHPSTGVPSAPASRQEGSRGDSWCQWVLLVLPPQKSWGTLASERRMMFCSLTWSPLDSEVVFHDEAPSFLLQPMFAIWYNREGGFFHYLPFSLLLPGPGKSSVSASQCVLLCTVYANAR